MIDEQLLLEYLNKAFRESRNAQAATASVVRSLVSALRDADRNKQADENEFAKVKQALLELIGHVSPRDFSKISGEELLDLVPIETIRNARDIHWARSKTPGTPLPPVPNAPHLIAQESSSGNVEIATVMHAHRRKDDSIAIKTDKDGSARLVTNIKMKALLGWIVAGIAGAYEIIKAIKGLGH